MKLMRSLFGTLTAVSMLFAAGVGVAYASQSWNSARNPLVAQGYGSKAYSYGTWGISRANGTQSRVDGFVKIANSDDHKGMIELVTFVNAGICVAPQYTQCNQQYYWHAKANSQRTALNTYQRVSAATSLDPHADYARARIRTVIDIPYRNDIPSNDVLTRGEKY